MSSKRAVADAGAPSEDETRATADVPEMAAETEEPAGTSEVTGTGGGVDAGKSLGTEETGKEPETGQAAEVEKPNAEEPAPESVDRAGGSGLRRFLRAGLLVPALVIALLAGSTAYLGWGLRTSNAVAEARSSASEAGRQYALDLTTYDYRNLEGNFAAVTQNSTEKFGEQYKEVSESLTALIQQYQATSEGTVIRQGVAEADEGRVVLTLFVDQSVSNTNTPQPRVDRNRMQMTLLREGDRWLLDDLRLL